MPFQSLPELSVDVKVVQERLSKATPEEVVSYKELSDLIGRDVQGSARSVLQSACRRLVRDHKIVFAAVRRIGVKRLSDEGILSLPTAAFDSMRRKSRKTALKLSAVNYNSLTREQQIQHNAGVSVLALVAHVTKPGRVKALEGSISNQGGGSLPIGKTLEAFSATS